MASTSGNTGIKRKAEDIIVDPDTQQPIEDAKNPRIELDSDRKYKCLKSIIEMYSKLLSMAFQRPIARESEMEVDGAETTIHQEASRNINVGNHIVSIIFTVHYISRQETKKITTNMMKKLAGTEEYALDSKKVKDEWVALLKKNGLIYTDFLPTDKENWFGTMGPNLDMFSAYSLRVNELRLGHNNMPISKVDGIHKSFPVSKYGLSGAHHVLLEGTSFPPERRSSIVQSIGPMTAWLCMIRSEGIYRKKYAAAVKRAMSHISCIDDLIVLTKNTRQASELSTVTTLLAETLLVTTARQATRMFFPLTMFAAVWNSEIDKRRFCNFFSTTGAGGWYTYKKLSEMKNRFSLGGQIEEEKASQIVYHGIFGTYKEDHSILSQITNISIWFTREELGTCFRQQGTSAELSKVTLPVMRYYSKMSCANQTGLLSGVYNQVATVPCFSGASTHKFDSQFFEHIEKKRIMGATGKTIAQIVNILTSTLEELQAQYTYLTL